MFRNSLLKFLYLIFLVYCFIASPSFSIPKENPHNSHMQFVFGPLPGDRAVPEVRKGSLFSHSMSDCQYVCL